MVKNSDVLYENRKELIKDIDNLTHKIIKVKNKIIHYKTTINIHMINLARYVIDNICTDNFDAKYTLDLIECINNHDNILKYNEKELYYLEHDRDIKLEHLKGLNSYLCII